MKIIGDPIDGQPITMHIIPSDEGWSGVLCQDGTCEFEMKGKTMDQDALLAFTKQVLIEKFNIKDDYKLKVVEE